LAERALPIRQKALPVGHAEIGKGIDTLAGLYEAQKWHSEAEIFFRRRIEFDERAGEIAEKSEPTVAVQRKTKRLKEESDSLKKRTQPQKDSAPADRTQEASLCSHRFIVPAHGRSWPDPDDPLTACNVCSLG
jgi:hypothetical protein